MRRPCADCEEKRVTYGDDEPDDDADQEQLDLDNPNQRGLSYQLREPRGSRSSGHIARAMREESGSAVGWDDTRWKVIRRRRSALASPRNETASPELGRASCRERDGQSCKARWQPYHEKKKK